MKFVYTGDPADQKEPLEEKQAFGLTFPIGEAVEVTDPATIKKLQANSHFSEEGQEPKKKGPKARKSAE